MLDRLDRRVLGGLRVVDHLSGQPIRHGIEIKAPGLTLSRAGGGAFAATAAPGFEEYVRAFDPVPAVVARPFPLEFHDLLRRFEPIVASITLPRNADPGAVADRVDTPVEFALPSAAGRATAGGWSVVRVEVLSDSGAPVRGALVRVLDAGTTNERGWSLTGKRGQALVPLVGLPQMRDAPPGGGGGGGGGGPPPPTVVATTPLDIRVTVDPAEPWPADPAALRAGGAGLRSAASASPVDLTAGGDAFLGLSVTLS